MRFAAAADAAAKSPSLRTTGPGLRAASLSVEELQLAVSDVAKLRGVLEPDRILRGERHACRCLGKRPVAQTPAGRLVHHLAVLRLNFADRHLPARGGRCFQHLAGRSAAT